MDWNLFEAELVAILILLEVTLQYELAKTEEEASYCRNPYFIGSNSAIK